MELSNIFSMLGGLALFLYGMNMMSNGLELAAGNKMKSILEKLTSNRILGVLVGALGLVYLVEQFLHVRFNHQLQRLQLFNKCMVPVLLV